MKINISNDAGSSLQTFYLDEYLVLVVSPQTYRRFSGQAAIKTANGLVMRDLIWVEIKVLKQDGVTEITDWIRQEVSLISRMIENDDSVCQVLTLEITYTSRQPLAIVFYLFLAQRMGSRLSFQPCKLITENSCVTTII